MNGDLTWQGAMALSESLSQRLRHELDRKSDTEALENERFIVALFQQVLSREPSEEEMERCSSFLQQRSGAALVLVLLNSNEFAFVP
jgi:type VI protein secretion system component VasK